MLVKDLIVGLLLGALLSAVWTSYYYNENFIKGYKKSISAQAQENVYLRKELLERNNELIQAYQYIKHLNFQIELFGSKVTSFDYQDSHFINSITSP